MKVKVFEIVKSGLSPLSEEMESIIQAWLDKNDQIEILGASQSQHLRENTVFVTIFYRLKDWDKLFLWIILNKH